MRRPDLCPHRRVVGGEGGPGVAICRFLQTISGFEDQDPCTVGPEACDACCSWPVPSDDRLNPVVASMLYELAGRVIADGGRPGCGTARADALRERAERELNLEGPKIPRHIRCVGLRGPTRGEPSPACDVVLCCAEADEATDRAVRSILAQEGVSATLHLVDDGGGGVELLRRYGTLPDVIPHRNRARLGLFRTLHERIPHLRNEFVAVQDAATTSRPDRLADATWLLRESGADLLATALASPGGSVTPSLPGGRYRRAVPSETLVFRRAALVDMGGVADRPVDADVELVHRASLERRSILLCRRVTVDRDGPPARPEAEAGPPPDYRPRAGSLRHHALGFPAVSIACDVILPFHGQLDYVREALRSLLEQEGAEVIVHLVDDASPDAVASEELLRHWCRHPRVRTYRNLRNLGQYSSFNNLVPALETGLVAVQDGDDISLPRRIHLAGNALLLSGADIFGGRVRVFGDESCLRPAWNGDPGGAKARRPLYRGSRVPPRRPAGSFLENPTAVLRKAEFERIGGFADFGQADRNRCGLDTELYLRAAYCGARFAVSNQVVVLYRCHADSATQNAETGWGSPARSWSLRENRRRIDVYRRGPFDPKAYGALGRFEGQTRRFAPGEMSG